MKILIAGGGTGGHLMPALALADALRAARPDVEPVLVGARRGVEAHILPQRGDYPFHLVSAEPLYRRSWWRNIRWIAALPRLIAQCARIVRRERPVLAVGTGGYAAGPILFWCHRRGIPIVLQEQNAYPGVTTRRLASKAAQIYLGFAEAGARLRPGPQTEVRPWGNPIAPPPTPRPGRDEAKRRLGIDPDGAVVLVVGGSQGAWAINRAVSAVLERGGWSEATVLWSTGAGTWNDYRHHDRPPWRMVRPFWDPLAEAYAAADVVVCRAGAMTTAEIQAWGLPAVLVPLPGAAADHQTANARALVEAGCAVLLPEASLDADRLDREVMGLLGDADRRAAMAAVAIERSQPGAARRIAEGILRLVQDGPTLS